MPTTPDLSEVDNSMPERAFSNMISSRVILNSEQERQENVALDVLPPYFLVDEQPSITKEIYEDLFRQHVEDTEIDIYQPRIDGYLDNVKEIDSGLNKYTILKLAEAYEQALENNSNSDHCTTDEEQETYTLE